MPQRNLPLGGRGRSAIAIRVRGPFREAPSGHCLNSSDSAVTGGRALDSPIPTRHAKIKRRAASRSREPQMADEVQRTTNQHARPRPPVKDWMQVLVFDG